MKIIKSRKHSSHLGLFAGLFAVALFATVAFTLNSTKPASAATVPESCFTFDSGTGTITAYDPTGTDPLCLKDVDIPATIGGVGVTVIGANAFGGKSLTSVTFPEGILSIAANAFAGNSIAGGLILPDSLQTIGPAAFYGSQITSLTLGSDLVTISSAAFNTNQISTIHFSPNSTLQSIGGSAFQGNQLTSLILPESIVEIYPSALDDNPLTSLSIGNQATDLWSGFVSGNTLETVYIGTEDYTGTPVIDLTNGHFYGITSLKNVFLGSSVGSIDYQAFAGTGIEEITIPASVSFIGVGGSPFDGTPLKEITFEGNTTLTTHSFNGVVSTTNQYIRLLTSDPSNPYGYTDQADTYIVNPAAVTVKYVDSHGNALSPELYQTGATLTDYTTTANPTADFSLYYRSGQSLSYSASAISGYQTPTEQSVSLLPGANTVTFVYYTPAEIAAMNTPTAPNTGLKHAVSPILYAMVGLVGVVAIAILVIKRHKTSK